MTKEEVIQKANDRGWYSHIHSSDGTWYVMTHKLYPFVIELWPDTNEFLLRYNTGLFVYQSAKCGSFTNDDHFNRLFREMRFMCMSIADAKEAYQERQEKRRRFRNAKDTD